MTPRERVLKTLDFEPVDRAPRHLWRLPWVEMFAADELAEQLEKFPEDIGTITGVTAPGDRRQGDACRIGRSVDDWGCVWECGEDGVCGEIKNPILADWSALDHYKLPWEILEKADWDKVNRSQEKNLAGPNRFLMTGGDTARPFERLQFLRGTENIMMDMAYDTAEFRKLLEMIHDFNCKAIEGWVGTDIDGIAFMDDWGSQTSLLISPDMWRAFFKPLYKEYCDIIHAAGKKAFMHSDGNITAIYEDIIEVGVDALNSQLFCMDLEELGEKYRGKITFWGEIDRQHILPFGTAEDVHKAVDRVRRALDNGHGGVIAQCEWGPGNPTENIRAVYEAWEMPIEKL